jgi:transcription elongation factor Elf1
MNVSYTPDQRRVITRALAREQKIDCPACGAQVTVTPVTPGRQVSYVRHRMMVVCPGCRRSAAVDVREREE